MLPCSMLLMQCLIKFRLIISHGHIGTFCKKNKENTILTAPTIAQAKPKYSPPVVIAVIKFFLNAS